ncbi:MAG TPA: hypothetical protein VNJ53_13215 [Gaiellaceae bacterium]|nr:hypothetical protein [Gaiellaceae bacterium]
MALAAVAFVLGLAVGLALARGLERASQTGWAIDRDRDLTRDGYGHLIPLALRRRTPRCS